MGLRLHIICMLPCIRPKVLKHIICRPRCSIDNILSSVRGLPFPASWCHGPVEMPVLVGKGPSDCQWAKSSWRSLPGLCEAQAPALGAAVVQSPPHSCEQMRAQVDQESNWLIPRRMLATSSPSLHIGIAGFDPATSTPRRLAKASYNKRI